MSDKPSIKTMEFTCDAVKLIARQTLQKPILPHWVDTAIEDWVQVKYAQKWGHDQIMVLARNRYPMP